MKKKIFKLLAFFIVTSCCYSLLFHYTAKAEDNNTVSVKDISTINAEDISTGETDNINTTITEYPILVNQIQVTQYPVKMTYTSGENLDLTGMIVAGYGYDGTINIITNYEVQGYDCNQVGNQTVLINYQNNFTFFNVTVLPAKVINTSVSRHSTVSHTITWDAHTNNTRYEIYNIDVNTGTKSLITITDINNITLYYTPGTIQSYQICAVQVIAGIEYRGELSDTYTAATNPNAVTGLTAIASTSSSVSLSWDEVIGSTGYIIYRSLATKSSYKYCGKSDSTMFTDKKLSSGQSYKYKVRAYTLNDTYLGSASSFVETSTNPAKMYLKAKAGDQKLRLTWGRVAGASSYEIYMGDMKSGFTLITTNSGNSNCSYIVEGLTTGQDYSFYAIAKRDYKEVIYDGQASDTITAQPEEIKNTSIDHKFFPTKKDLLNSASYKKTFLVKNLSYAKSIVIPGLISTNIGGFSSTSMCPQAITFAEDYLLLTAYDRSAEENSVIYVMDKSSRKLLTTLILPSKHHVGGIGYDGVNVWITTGSKVSSVLFSELEAAAQIGASYAHVKYNTTIALGISASYITYYDEKLWVGSYNELKTTYMYSYVIENKETDPTLIKTDTIIMPTRVQGAAFTSKGILILSRSCQLYKGLRGYIRQLDVYSPEFSDEYNGIISLGKSINSVQMPSMNEGIAIDGSYLYINFESGAFDNASYKMDRICAIKINSVIKKKVTTT